MPLPRLLRSGEIRKALYAAADEADKVREALQGFLNEKFIEVIATGNVPASRIVPNYFAGRPPFGPGRKKDEFPDAIAIEAIKDYAGVANPDVEVHVISGDGDWASALRSRTDLTFHARIADALQYIRKLENVADALEKLLVGKQTTLNDVIADEFPSLSFSLEDDWNADVADVVVIDSSIDDVTVVASRNRRAHVNFDCQVHFTCNVTYTDHEFSVWDSEENDYGFQSVASAQVEMRLKMTGTVQIVVSQDMRNLDAVEEMSLVPNDIAVSFDEADRVTRRYDNDDDVDPH